MARIIAQVFLYPCFSYPLLQRRRAKSFGNQLFIVALRGQPKEGRHMSDAQPESGEVRKRLWKELKDAKIVMIGLVGGDPHHLQPMAAYGDESGDAIWFFTKQDSDLFKDCGKSHDAMACIMAKDMEFQACIHGALSQDRDVAKIDEFWSPFLSAWYPAGKTDPTLAMMRLDPKDARVWISNSGPILYPLKIAKANLTHTLPNIGTTTDIKM